jgi:hypothetical protein
MEHSSTTHPPLTALVSTTKRASRRLIPLVIIMFVVNYIDRSAAFTSPVLAVGMLIVATVGFKVGCIVVLQHPPAVPDRRSGGPGHRVRQCRRKPRRVLHTHHAWTDPGQSDSVSGGHLIVAGLCVIALASCALLRYPTGTPQKSPAG